MDDRAKRRLLQLNDRLLHSLIAAPDDAARQLALGTIVVEHAVPVIRRVLARYRYSEQALLREDADDIASAVTVRLVRKLHLALESEGGAIERLDDYVATQTYNGIYDVLRKRFPERTRLRNRLRYALEHDPRLAIWQTAAGLVAGNAGMRGAAATAKFSRLADVSHPAVHDRTRPADALSAVFDSSAGPLLFTDVVAAFAELWGIHDAIDVSPPVEPADQQPSQFARLESRQYLDNLWTEIRLLPPSQRSALLLNLRDVEGLNAVALFVTVGVASIDDVAAVIGISAERLAALWSEFPLDDLTIAAMLGITRQQVINLRKSARERLSRRMNKK